MYQLKIKYVDGKEGDVKKFYSNHTTFHKGDCGIDLFCLEDQIFKGYSLGKTIHFGIKCELKNPSKDGPKVNIIKSQIDELEDFIYGAEHRSDKKHLTDNFLSDYLNNLKSIRIPELQKKITDIENKSYGYMLVPRSSISKTPLRMSNCIGIIDPGYRGEIMAKVDNLSAEDFQIKRGERLFQIVLPILKSFNIGLVDSLSETTRDTGGFGSTN